MNLEGGSFISSRLVSSSQKRQIMWNIIEPGDPYDIRKSMIARLPGHKNFMGNHLELVCLLQAAEIQRLCEYLQQYKLKFREIERRQLDRHSYEIQIKELSQQLSQDGSFKLQNLKLKEFLRKQTTQFQDLKKRLAGFDSELGRKYEDSLRQIEALLQENQMLKSNSTKMRLQFQQIINTKTLETEELQRRLREASSAKSIANEQKSQAYFKLEIQFKKLEFENKRIKEILDFKNREIQELQGKSKQFIYQIQELTVQLNQHGNMGHTLAEYQNRFALLGQELDRLNLVLRQKTGQLNDISNKYRLSEQENRRKIQYIQQVQRKKEIIEENYRQLDLKLRQSLTNLSGIDESKNLIKTYEFNLQKLSGEIQRLNNVLRKKVQELDDAARRIGELDYEVRKNESARKQVEDFRIKYSEFNKKIIDYESKIALLSQELQRINSNLKRKAEQNSYLQQQVRNSQYEIENYQKKLQDLDVQYKLEINRVKNTQIARYQQELSVSRQDQEKQRILDKFEIQINILRNQQIQNRQILAEYENRIVSSANEINRLNSLLKRQSSPSKQETLHLKKITEYENKLAIMNQQMQRLNENLRSKVNENKNLELRLKQYESDVQFSRKREIQGYISTINQLERKNGSLSNQNSQISRKINDFQYQITTLSNQIQRLNTVLKQKIDQIQSIEQKFRNSSREAQEYRRKVTEYEYKITTITKEYQLERESLSKNNQYQLENARRQLIELQRYNREYQIKISQYENQLRNVYQQSDRTTGQFKEQKKKFSQYQNRIIILSQEIQRLNQLLQKMNQENNINKKKVSEIQYLKSTIVTLEQKFSRAVQQNDELRKGTSELNLTKTRVNQQYEFKIRTLTQQNQQLLRNYKEIEYKLSVSSKEIQRLSNVLKGKVQEISTLQSKIRSVYQDNEAQNRKIKELANSNRKIAEYDNKISILSQEIERLNEVLRMKVEQINNYESRCRNYDLQLNKYQRKIQDYQNSINRELSTKIAFLNKENEELKLKVKQLINEVNKIPDLQSKFGMVYSEVQRLNSNLKLKIQEIVLLQTKTRNYEQEIEKYRRRNQEIENTMHKQLKNQSSVFQQRVYQLTQQNDGLRKNLRELSDTNRRISQYENRMNILSKQIQRLNELLMKYTKEIVPSLEEKLRNASYENEDLKKNFSDYNQLSKGYQELNTKYKITSQQNQQNYRRVQEYENRMTQISGQIERLNNVMRSKIEELNISQNKLRQAATEIDTLNKKIRQFNEVHRKIPEMESHIALLSQQIERLNTLLKTKIQESNNFQRELRRYKLEYENLQRKNNDYEVQIAEYKHNRSIFEQKLSNLGHQNQDLRKGICQLTDSNRRIADYESRMALLSQEIQRLNMNLRMKIQELSSLDTLFKNYKRQSEIKLSNFFNQLQEQKRRNMQNMGTQSNKIAEYQNKLVILSQQIQRLNYLLKEQTYQIQVLHKKQPQFLNEIQRLNNTLRLKVEQTTRWEQANIELKARLKSSDDNLHLTTQEYQKLKHSHHTLTQEYNRVNKHLVEYEQSINKLYQQFQRLQNMLQELKKQNYEYKLKLQQSGNLIEMNRALGAQIDRLTIIMKTQSKDLEDLRLALADQAALQKRINEDMALMVVLFAEIESLRKRVKQTEIQIQTVRRSSLVPFKV